MTPEELEELTTAEFKEVFDLVQAERDRRNQVLYAELYQTPAPQPIYDRAMADAAMQANPNTQETDND